MAPKIKNGITKYVPNFLSISIPKKEHKKIGTSMCMESCVIIANDL